MVIKHSRSLAKSIYDTRSFYSGEPRTNRGSLVADPKILGTVGILLLRCLRRWAINSTLQNRYSLGKRPLGTKLSLKFHKRGRRISKIVYCICTEKDDREGNQLSYHKMKLGSLGSGKVEKLWLTWHIVHASLAKICLGTIFL